MAAAKSSIALLVFAIQLGSIEDEVKPSEQI
jgi:hypothetical protein